MVLFRHKITPRNLIWDWIQVEVTTRCNAMCCYCPRTIAGKSWPQHDLPMELFHRLLEDLSRTGYLHLQGWGEPFLHPELFQMVELFRKAGCPVGTTTNGTLMNQDLAHRIVKSGFQVVAFSLAGTGLANDRIRKGAPLEKVLEGIRLLAKAKARAGSSIPEIHIAYMLLSSAEGELPGLPDLLAGMPVSQVVVSTLDCVLDRSLESEVMAREDQALLSCLAQVGKRLAAQGILLHHHLGGTGKACFPCTENVLGAVVVGAQGDVGPCVYTNLDLAQGRQWKNGKEEPLPRLCFGNLAQNSLMGIWEDPAYIAFRRSFSQGSLEPACTSCPKRCSP